ncbi:MAG: hypothetical protein IPP09_08325 [Elusimicrobia bacterium]|nr:hypothetical protein [Elusimicrobiota bacterium]
MSERHFDGDLKDLDRRLLAMGALCETMIQKAVKALIDRNPELTQEVFRHEEEANRFHIEIDDIAIKLIALHQPMAGDLRFLAAAMKINNDLERIADMAVNASQTAFYHLFNEPPVPEINMVTHMAEVAQRMLRDSLDAYATGRGLAQRVLASGRRGRPFEGPGAQGIDFPDPDRSPPFRSVC